MRGSKMKAVWIVLVFLALGGRLCFAQDEETPALETGDAVVPSEAQAYQDIESGEAWTLLKFGLGSVTTNPDQVSEVLIDWQLDGVPANDRSEYSLYIITGQAALDS